MLALNSLTSPEKTAVTRCRALDSMTSFYLLVDASGQGFGSVMWDHEGLRYDLVYWSTQWENETSNRKEGNNITVRFEELAWEKKLDNGAIFILTDNQVFEGLF